MVVEIGQSPAVAPRPVDYQPAGPGLPFECFTLEDLRRRVGAAELSGLQRLHFDMVIACTQGRGSHEVDFETVDLDRHHWLHVRAGQVHRWHLGDYQATLILLSRPATARHWRPGPHVLVLDDDQLHDAEPLLQLAQHRRRTDIGPAAVLAIRDLLVAWLGLDRAEPAVGDPLYADFRALLERQATAVRTVEFYAGRLGCSPRTLGRACRRAGAPSPKRLIDEAVLLEAKRRLALPGATATATAEALHFSEVTNFTKFFKRLASIAPSEWVAQAHGSSADVAPA